MKKAISILMVTVLCILSLNVAAFAQVSSDNSAEIEALLDKRAELICLEKWDEINSIDEQLAALGVEKLTPEEVEKLLSGTDGIMPNAVVPGSSNATWLSTRSNYSYGGVAYEIQTIIAQPNQNNSNLKTSGSRALSSRGSLMAAALDALAVVAWNGISSIPGANVAFTVYDAAKAFVNGLAPTTEISAADVVYSYAHTTTVSFKYVKIKGQSDNLQNLTYISTKGTTSVGYQFPTFVYSGGSVSPNIIQGSRTIYSTPNGYNSDLNAVKAYSDPYSPTRSYVDRVVITGLESKSVSTIYPACPEFPAQIG